VLLEELAYSPDGQPLISTLLDYLGAAGDRHARGHHAGAHRVAQPAHGLGSKGAGEGGTIGAFAAVANAVADALAPLGVILTDLPYSPDRIFNAVRSRGTKGVISDQPRGARRRSR